MLKTFLALKELIYPTTCAGCNLIGIQICNTCGENWQAAPKLNFVGKQKLYFVAKYNPQSARIILSAKENTNKFCIDLLAHCIARSITFALPVSIWAQQITITTIPSSPAAIRRRGRDHISELAKQVVKLLATENISATYIPILYLAKNIKDQSGLNSSQRAQNLSGAFSIKNCEIPTGDLFLIDDLVTTGASIQEGVRALANAKISITAVITACAVGRNSLIR